MPEYNLHLSDNWPIMIKMGPNSVASVIMDPPYGLDVADWDAAMPVQQILTQCKRICSGPIVQFGSATHLLRFADYSPRPDRILIWAPKFTLLKVAKDGLAYRFHPIAVWRPTPQRAIPWDLLDDATDGRNWWEHPGTKPLSLMLKLVQAFSPPGGIVLDPYMGSGTTGVACMQLGRHFIGIDSDPVSFEIASKRIAEAALQPPILVEDYSPTQAELFGG